MATNLPTQRPTISKSQKPSVGSTGTPTSVPTKRPSDSPSFVPTDQPSTSMPTGSPSQAPTTPKPSSIPIKSPSASPTIQPTNSPSLEPTSSFSKLLHPTHRSYIQSRRSPSFEPVLNQFRRVLPQLQSVLLSNAEKNIHVVGVATKELCVLTSVRQVDFTRNVGGLKRVGACEMANPVDVVLGKIFQVLSIKTFLVGVTFRNIPQLADRYHKAEPNHQLVQYNVAKMRKQLRVIGPNKTGTRQLLMLLRPKGEI